VEDVGSGIPPEVAERVFEPYFTTREGEGGTGLGLSTTHALVSDAGGAVVLQSTPGEGTTFTLVLPVVA
jgi:signal transduction histidine kinase